MCVLFLCVYWFAFFTRLLFRIVTAVLSVFLIRLMLQNFNNFCVVQAGF